MLDRVALIPKRERAVDLILAPLCRQRHFDAPSPEYALGELADWLVDREREITEAEAKRVVKRVLEKRRQNFRQVDVQDAVKALSATPDGSVPINKADDPEACAAWLRYAQQRERTNLAMRTIVYMLAKHDRALVPSRYPPSGAAAK